MKDRFSSQAKKYAAFRPTYPKELYDFILQHTPIRECAWDAGTGNGQVARDLCAHFKKIIATDISERQLEQAIPAENIAYAKAGEETDAPRYSFDLITVAQAIHWFDREKFYAEVRRAGKKGGLLAVWGYGLLRINEAIDAKMDRFYSKIIGPYWDKERRLVDEHYTTISFPFKEIATPPFRFSFQWKLEELLGYLETWSSVRNYKEANNSNPVPALIDQIAPFWKGETLEVSFPLFMRVGRI